MFRVLLPVVCLGVVLASPVRAESGNPPGDLAVHILASDSPAFIEEWMSTPFQHPVRVRKVDHVERGRVTYIAFLVTGHSLGEDGRALVDVSVRVLRPDRSVAFSDSSYAHVASKCPRIGFVMADAGLDFGVDVRDPLGAWTIEAVAHDRVAGKHAPTSHTLHIRRPATAAH